MRAMEDGLDSVLRDSGRHARAHGHGHAALPSPYVTSKSITVLRSVMTIHTVFHRDKHSREVPSRDGVAMVHNK